MLWNDFLKFTFSFWVFLNSLGFILTREQLSANLEEQLSANLEEKNQSKEVNNDSLHYNAKVSYTPVSGRLFCFLEIL